MKQSVYKSALTSKSTGSVVVVLNVNDIKVLNEALEVLYHKVCKSDERHLYSNEHKLQIQFTYNDFSRIIGEGIMSMSD